MTSLYLYGITDRRPALPEGLRAVEVGSVAGVYAEREPEAPTGEALWRHEAVVERLLEQGPVLPARYGTALADVGRLREELEGRAASFGRALDLVRGRVELGVRAAWPDRPGDPARATSGREYLAVKLEQQRAAEQATGDVHEPLARLAVAATVEVGHLPCLSLAAAYLVDEDQVERFRSEADRLASDLDGVRLACTGPWPPYSFASEEDA
jgi:Gas vesicle synthesis protein GvpL/GvpF